MGQYEYKLVDSGMQGMQVEAEYMQVDESDEQAEYDGTYFENG